MILSALINFIGLLDTYHSSLFFFNSFFIFPRFSFFLQNFMQSGTSSPLQKSQAMLSSSSSSTSSMRNPESFLLPLIQNLDAGKHRVRLFLMVKGPGYFTDPPSSRGRHIKYHRIHFFCLNFSIIFSKSLAVGQYRAHSRQATHTELFPLLSSARDIKNPRPFPLSKTLIADTEGMNSPLCLKEQPISQVLCPPPRGISNMINIA
jgi:hypothetical protein